MAGPVRDAAAAWLDTRHDPDSGCLVIDHTEGTIDSFWALASTGPAYECPAPGLRDCLLREYWDPVMGRFKGGTDWWQPSLDNQTWGGAFLEAIGQSSDALRAFRYAHDVLMLPAQGGQLSGLDGHGGPWSVWNEGVGQYTAVGGEGATTLVQEPLAQQRLDGAMPGQPDDFAGAGVWTTPWHGIAPTAWNYFALTGGPFPASLPPGPTAYLLDLSGTTIDDVQNFQACDSILVRSGFRLDPTAVVTLSAGRQVVFASNIVASKGSKLSVSVGAPWAKARSIGGA